MAKKFESYTFAEFTKLMQLPGYKTSTKDETIDASSHNHRQYKAVIAKPGIARVEVDYRYLCYHNAAVSIETSFKIKGRLSSYIVSGDSIHFHSSAGFDGIKAFISRIKKFLDEAAPAAKENFKRFTFRNDEYEFTQFDGVKMVKRVGLLVQAGVAGIGQIDLDSGRITMAPSAPYDAEKYPEPTFILRCHTALTGFGMAYDMSDSWQLVKTTGKTNVVTNDEAHWSTIKFADLSIADKVLVERAIELYIKGQ